VGYYDTWGNLGPESYGDYLGLRFPTKWISADGKTLWGVFSSLGRYDSFNLVKVRLTVASSIPEVKSPAQGAALTPGAAVTTRGAGSRLRWSIERFNTDTGPGADPVPGTSPAYVASGKGRSITFTVPLDARAGDVLRITLAGRGGRVYRDCPINTASPVAAGPQPGSAATPAGTRAPAESWLP
jgi:hypothetical protein